MKFKKDPLFFSQKGFTLPELLVTLVIGSIVMLGAVELFKNIFKAAVSTELSTEANHAISNISLLLQTKQNCSEMLRNGGATTPARFIPPLSGSTVSCSALGVNKGFDDSRGAGPLSNNCGMIDRIVNPSNGQVLAQVGSPISKGVILKSIDMQAVDQVAGSTSFTASNCGACNQVPPLNWCSCCGRFKTTIGYQMGGLIKMTLTFRFVDANLQKIGSKSDITATWLIDAVLDPEFNGNLYSDGACSTVIGTDSNNLPGEIVNCWAQPLGVVSGLYLCSRMGGQWNSSQGRCFFSAETFSNAPAGVAQPGMQWIEDITSTNPFPSSYP